MPKVPAGSSIIFYEDFTSPASVVQNGCIAVGSPKIDHGVTITTTSTYLTNTALAQTLGRIANSNKKLSFKFDVERPANLSTYRTIISLRNADSIVFEIGFSILSGTIYIATDPTGTGTATIVSSSTAVPSGRHTVEVVMNGTNAYYYIDGVAIGSSACQFGPWTTQDKVFIGRTYIHSQSLESKLYSITISNTVDTAEEAKDFYEKDTYSELERPLIDLPLRSSYYYYKENGTNLVANNGFEGSASPLPISWGKINGLGTREAGTRTGGAGSYVGQIAYDGVNANGQLYQNVMTVGRRYKIKGWVKASHASISLNISDGAGSDYPFAAGSAPTDWTYFEFELVADSIYITLYCANLVAGNWVQWDDISVQLMENLTENKGSLGGTAKMGDGTLTTMPTLLSPHGAGFRSADLSYITLSDDGLVIDSGVNAWGVFRYDKAYVNLGFDQSTILTSASSANGFLSISVQDSTGYLRATIGGGALSTKSKSSRRDYRNGYHTFIFSCDVTNAVLYVDGIEAESADASTITSVEGTYWGRLNTSAILKWGGDLHSLRFDQVSNLITPEQAKILHVQLMKNLNI